jgi:hypothetical protein
MDLDEPDRDVQGCRRVQPGDAFIVGPEKH